MDEKNATQRFQEALLAESIGVLSQLPRCKPDIYAVSFLLENQDPSGPTLEISYNTEQPDCPQGVTPEEWRWNYAYWLQDPIYVIPRSDSARASRSDWLRTHGISFEGPAPGCVTEKEDFDLFLERLDKVSEEFYKLAEHVAAEILCEGVISQRLGYELPIIIHDLEYSEPGLAATYRINRESSLLDGFRKFIGEA